MSWMEQLIAALNGYDLTYKEKAKLVVEAIENGLSQQKQFSAADVSHYLEFDCARHLRMLARAGFLQVVPARKAEPVLERQKAVLSPVRGPGRPFNRSPRSWDNSNSGGWVFVRPGWSSPFEALEVVADRR
jgi:hypothetical protein